MPKRNAEQRQTARQKARERQRRYRERMAITGAREYTIRLPWDAVGILEEIRGNRSPSEVIAAILLGPSEPAEPGA